MKMTFSKQVYDQLSDDSQAELIPVTCDCVTDDQASESCAYCDGGGVIYEKKLSLEDEKAIVNNLRSQGVPIGKDGTN